MQTRFSLVKTERQFLQLSSTSRASASRSSASRSTTCLSSASSAYAVVLQPVMHKHLSHGHSHLSSRALAMFIWRRFQANQGYAFALRQETLIRIRFQGSRAFSQLCMGHYLKVALISVVLRHGVHGCLMRSLIENLKHCCRAGGLKNIICLSLFIQLATSQFFQKYICNIPLK